jgi:hypothetical protein
MRRLSRVQRKDDPQNYCISSVEGNWFKLEHIKKLETKDSTWHPSCQREQVYIGKR